MKFSPRKIEEIISTEKLIDPAVQEVMQAYEEQKQSIENILKASFHNKAYHQYTVPRILNPQQITELTIPLDDQSGVSYLNRILQDSYNAGHNNFTIQTNDQAPDMLCAYFNATTKNPLLITIKGNNGSYLGYNSENLDIRVQGNNSYIRGFRSTNLRITITGNNDCISGEGSEHLTVTIKGNNDMLATENYTTFCNANITIYGTTKIGEHFYQQNVQNAKFYTKLKKTYDLLKAAGATVEMIK